MSTDIPPTPPPTSAVRVVVPGGFGRAVLTDLRNDIKAAVYTYEKRISLAGAIGLLEIVKQELITEHQT